MNKEKILGLKKVSGKFQIVLNRISEYKEVCGVWVMYGDGNQMLEVAQTSDIFKELSYDLSWLTKDYSHDVKGDKRYTARRLFEFNQKFDVLSCDKDRTSAKYRTIAANFKEISVYLVDEVEARSKDKSLRENLELKIAIDNKALYWNAFGKQRRKAKEYYFKIKNVLNKVVADSKS